MGAGTAKQLWITPIVSAGSSADLNLNEIFAAQTPYLAPNALAPSSLQWHSHHGYLINHVVPVAYQQLDNINVSRVVVGGVHQIQILTSHRATFRDPLYKIWSANKPQVSVIQENLHSQNKCILAKLLSPEVQLKINLNKPKE